MGKIGNLGTTKFVVSDKTVRTFENLKWDVSAKYATHDRHLKADLLEFLGPEPDSISLPVKFSVFLGTNLSKKWKSCGRKYGADRRNTWSWAAMCMGHTSG